MTELRLSRKCVHIFCCLAPFCLIFVCLDDRGKSFTLIFFFFTFSVVLHRSLFVCLDDRIRFTLNVLMFSVVLYHSVSLGDRVRLTLKICSFFFCCPVSFCLTFVCLDDRVKFTRKMCSYFLLSCTVLFSICVFG